MTLGMVGGRWGVVSHAVCLRLCGIQGPDRAQSSANHWDGTEAVLALRPPAFVTSLTELRSYVKE